MSTSTSKSEQLTVAWMRSIGFQLDSRAGLLQLEGLSVDSIRESREDWKWRLEQVGRIPAPKTRSAVLQLCDQLKIRLANHEPADAVEGAPAIIIYPRIAA